MGLTEVFVSAEVKHGWFTLQVRLCSPTCCCGIVGLTEVFVFAEVKDGWVTLQVRLSAVGLWDEL